MADLLIVGAGGLGRMIGEVAAAQSAWEHIAFLDDAVHGPAVVGRCADYTALAGRYSQAVAAFGDNRLRLAWTKRLLAAGYTVPCVVHPSAVVSPSAQLGEGCFLLEQALSPLQNLHARCRVAIVTNGITQVQKRRLQLSGLHPYVDALVVSQEEGVSKPDPRIVERALERLGCADRAQAAIVGDSLTSDMAAARNARVDGIWYNPKGLPRPADAPHIVAEIRQLHDLMQFV